MRLLKLHVGDKSFDFPVNENDEVSEVREFLSTKGHKPEEYYCLVDRNGHVIKKMIGANIDEIHVVKLSSITSKFLIFKCKSKKFEVHEEVVLADLVTYYLFEYLNMPSFDYSTKVNNKLFPNDDKTPLRNIHGKIIWVSESRPQLEMQPVMYITESIPDITAADLHSNIKVLRERVKTFENSPLVSKAMKEKSFTEKMLRAYPKAQIKYVFPGGDFYIFEYDSRDTIFSILESMCTSLDCCFEILKFSVPGVILKDISKLEILRTELFPRCTIYVSEYPK